MPVVHVYVVSVVYCDCVETPLYHSINFMLLGYVVVVTCGQKLIVHTVHCWCSKLTRCQVEGFFYLPLTLKCCTHVEAAAHLFRSFPIPELGV